MIKKPSRPMASAKKKTAGKEKVQKAAAKKAPSKGTALDALQEKIDALYRENAKFTLREELDAALSTLATKEELKKAALKVEISRMMSKLATKEDVRIAAGEAATKKELQEAIDKRVEKEDLVQSLAGLATKEELRQLAGFAISKDALDKAVAGLATKEEIGQCQALLSEWRREADSQIQALRAVIEGFGKAIPENLPKEPTEPKQEGPSEAQAAETGSTNSREITPPAAEGEAPGLGKPDTISKPSFFNRLFGRSKE